MKPKANILVTGADGFIGSHLVEMLVKKGCRVRALSQYNSFNHWGWLEDIPCLDKVEVVTGDLRDSCYCDKITSGIDIVFHLAALIAIPHSYVSPDAYVQTNIIGTVNMCHAVLKNRCNKLIHTSSSEVYGTASYVPIDEEHPLQPKSPYSATKIGADAMAMSFHNSFDLPLVIARPFNVYGPRQSARAVIPTIITQIAAGRKKVNLGNLSTFRDFTYVEDTCAALIEIAECTKAVGKTINIGTGQGVTIKELFNTIKALMGSDAVYARDDKRLRPQRSEVFNLKCDNSRLKDLTGFSPKYSLREGLKKTIAWFTEGANLKKYKTKVYNV